MTDNNTVTQEAVRKMADSMGTVFVLCLLTNAYDAYRFLTTRGEIRQGMGIAVGLLVTGLVWQLGRELRGERKQALYYWLGIGMLGYARWIYVDGNFNLSLFSIILLSLAVALTLRIVIWIRNGALA